MVKPKMVVSLFTLLAGMSHPFVAMKHLFFGHIFLKILVKRPTSTIVFEMRQRNLTFFLLLAGSDV